MKRAILAIIAILAVILSTMNVASATTESYSLNVGLVIRDVEGSRHTIANGELPDRLRGLVCSVSYGADNNSSVHPGNDLLVTNSGHTATLAGVEDVRNQTTFGDSSWVVTDLSVVVVLVMGPDEVFSADAGITFECEAPPTTTTIVTPTTAPPTTAPPTIVPPTTIVISTPPPTVPPTYTIPPGVTVPEAPKMPDPVPVTFNPQFTG